MEQNASIRAVQDQIQVLDCQLFLHNEALHACEQSAISVQEEIEEYFAKCLDALATRKAALLAEVSQKLRVQRQKTEETVSAIDAYKTVLNAGLRMHSTNRTAAENIWKEIQGIPNVPVTTVRIQASLPTDFIDSIQTNGNVKESRPRSLKGIATTFAGSTQGFENGNGVAAKFNLPRGIFLTPDNWLYVCDYANNAIRKISLQGSVTTLSTQSVSYPYDIAVCLDSSIFVTNYDSHTITKMFTNANNSNQVFAGCHGEAGCVDGTGSTARFNNPSGIAIDQQTGNIFVAEAASHKIRKITPQGQVSTLAGSQRGFADGRGAAAQFSNPNGIVFDPATQSLLVCDRLNEKIRRVKLNGDVSTVCDIPAPSRITLTPHGTILVTSNKGGTLSRVIKIEQNYQVEIIAGTREAKTTDGTLDVCSFNGMVGIAYHAAWNSCFIVEAEGNCIRRVAFS